MPYFTRELYEGDPTQSREKRRSLRVKRVEAPHYQAGVGLPP